MYFILGFVGGVIVFCLIEAFGHIDGVHINPVITVLFTLCGKVSVIKGIHKNGNSYPIFFLKYSD